MSVIALYFENLFTFGYTTRFGSFDLYDLAPHGKVSVGKCFQPVAADVFWPFLLVAGCESSCVALSLVCIEFPRMLLAVRLSATCVGRQNGGGFPLFHRFFPFFPHFSGTFCTFFLAWTNWRCLDHRCWVSFFTRDCLSCVFSEFCWSEKSACWSADR